MPRNTTLFLIFSCSLFFVFGFKNDKKILNEEKEKLSEYNFFTGKLNEQTPNSDIIPYRLNTPLFSDYAEKLRFIKLPNGQKTDYNPDKVLQFPIGTVIIKTFYFPNDFRDFSKGRKLIETRLLIHEENGWKALEYVWNDEQTEAFLEVAGDRKNVQYVDNQGKIQKQEYVVPNLNQCKGCHNHDEVMTPIGPSVRQLNGDFDYENGTENQLLHWQKNELLVGLPSLENVPKTAVWNDEKSGSLDDRARAWLDINCAHCHNTHGPAKTSGLHLNYDEKDLSHLGLMKTPVAAGKGSGNRKYGIVPGHPEQSILTYRIENLDPGEMMPELGRKVNHKEGVALIKKWIKSL
jgi:uncharacterized repeat protein (TIGR03806 family)